VGTCLSGRRTSAPPRRRPGLFVSGQATPRKAAAAAARHARSAPAQANRPGPLHRLLRSCQLLGEDDRLTDQGTKLAAIFGTRMPNKLPATAGRCSSFPCLSEAGKVEQRCLQRALFGGCDDAETRNKTVREVGTRRLRGTRGQPESILREYLQRRPAESGGAARLFTGLPCWNWSRSRLRSCLFTCIATKDGGRATAEEAAIQRLRHSR